jgi:hypothetical protein
LKGSWVSYTVKSLSFCLIMFQNSPLHIPEDSARRGDTFEPLLSWQTRMFPLHTFSLVFGVKMEHPRLITRDNPVKETGSSSRCWKNWLATSICCCLCVSVGCLKTHLAHFPVS